MPFSLKFLHPFRIKFSNSPTLLYLFTTNTPPFSRETKCSLKQPTYDSSMKTFVDWIDALSTTILNEWKMFDGTLLFKTARSSKKYSPFNRYPDVKAGVLLECFGGFVAKVLWSLKWDFFTNNCFYRKAITFKYHIWKLNHHNL